MESNNQRDRYISIIDAGIRDAENKTTRHRNQMPAPMLYADYSNHMAQVITYGIMIAVMQVAKKLLESDTNQVILHLDAEDQKHSESKSEEDNVLLSGFNAAYSVIEQQIKPIKELDANREYYLIINRRLSMCSIVSLFITGLVTIIIAILCSAAIVSPTIFGIAAGAALCASLLIVASGVGSAVICNRYREQSNTQNEALLKETQIIQAGYQYENPVVRIIPLLETPSIKPIFKGEGRLFIANDLMVLGLFNTQYPFNQLVKHNTLDLKELRSRLIVEEDDVKIGPPLSK